MMQLQAFAVAAVLVSCVTATNYGPPHGKGYGWGSWKPSATSQWYSQTALPTTASIDVGVVIGTTTSLPSATAVVNKFLGVPFAQSPPVRFAKPVKPAKFAAPIQATAWKPACIQQFVYPALSQNFTKAIFNEPAPAESEDCLYLNVYAPSTPPPPSGRAVLFWIYGGSLEFGTAGQPAYDGSAFAAYQDVILVSTNYRTNIFGFPNGTPEIPTDSSNLGFFDQRLALQWVQDNIAAFGGDPDKVTIFGESAGAFSTDALLTSFTTDTAPFRGAILESGQISYNPAPRVSSPGGWAQVAAALNCPAGQSNLTCLRAAPATTIKNIIETQIITFQPIPDNITLVASPEQAREAGKIALVPVMGGTNAQEGRVFEFGQSNLTQYLTTTFTGAAAALIPYIRAAYPQVGNVAGINQDFDVISDIFTDLVFQCSQALWANASSSAAKVPTWRYYYNASFPNQEIFVGSGVYHSSEIIQVFQTYPGGPVNNNTLAPEGLQPTQLPPTSQQVALSKFMNQAWAAFAKDPMAGPGWPALGSFPEDLASLGPLGSSGATMIKQSTVDFRCPVWFPIYKAIGPPANANLFGLGG